MGIQTQFGPQKPPAPLYRRGEPNHCPGCGGTHWLVGRRTTECARCDTAIENKDAEIQTMLKPQPRKPLWLFLLDRIIFS